MWQVCVTVIWGGAVKQLPTFLLNGDTHGILSAEGIRPVVESIVNPFNLATVTLQISAEKI